ncbi:MULTISPECIES: iron-sulfur cluster biosynthesis family protein [Bacillaceae]|uniref:iron-sulfur cluster biosynthesis family protein n=1 Tax=Bacillaceae TaxID=186817 RepID=UPI001C55F011|nr:iron-sulfur cluster biosynthesis family protein [Rossellomorea sp. YZS02]MBW3113412.1 iron-sulfur cluster biosynthesis family protein [Bacillus sp. MCCB 382]MDX8344894.1 iron-sulfur cluster biosynthesis family protein [Rossellomorea sp. YZS02]
MKIELTNEAIRKIQDKIENEKGHLKLKYDTEGCGCVVSGIPTLWFVEHPADGEDIEVETNSYPILVEKSKMVFLDEELKIDFSQESNTFQLKSPGQIINGRMSFLMFPRE